MSKEIKWGVAAPGAIAKQFATALAGLPDAVCCAVGSRSLEKAKNFAAEYGFSKAYGSYEEVAKDPEIDVVYICPPHPFHVDVARLCLDHGKAVLCEKPLTVNASQAREIAELAGEKQLFLMEGMWTRLLPIFEDIRGWIDSDRIGEIKLLKADLGFRADKTSVVRLFDPHLGGGALLDVGVYVIALAYWVFGMKPDTISSTAWIGDTGVDEQAAIILGYNSTAASSNGRGVDGMAVLTCSVRVGIPPVAEIIGTKGMIRIEPPFGGATEATLLTGGESESISRPKRINGFEYEAAEVMRCLRAGEIESPYMPLSESISIMETMDTIRASWNLEYPCERK